MDPSGKPPNKRFRLEDEVEKESKISKCVLPSASQKSTITMNPKQSNHPRKAKKSLHSFIVPTFNKASELLKESKDSDSICLNSLSSQQQIVIPERRYPHRFSQDPLYAGGKCSKRIRKLSSSDNDKITNYITILHGSKKRKLEECSAAAGSSSTASSGFEEDSESLSARRSEAFFNKCSLLIESTQEEQNTVRYFERMPIHVMENILCQLPYADMVSCRTVCKGWNDIIRDDQFMKWKKMYYHLKSGDQQSLSYMGQICKDLSVLIIENCFPCIIMYMTKSFGKKPSSDMYERLMQNPKAFDSELLLTERFPDLTEKECKVWGIMAAAVILSETVDDVYSIYKSICGDGSGAYILDITEAMYCVATFLLHFKNTFAINHGLHYRLYCALYWIENNIPQKDAQSLKIAKGIPGQQSMHSYCDPSKSNLTYEQLRILNHCFQPGQIVKIVALAGTGKTSTLIHLARLYPQVNFLNIMFNRAVCEGAKNRFPPNVTCKTAHSLAFSIFGSRLKSKLSSKIRPHDIVTLLQFHENAQLQIHSYSRLVLSTIEAFMYSADREILLEHVPKKVSDMRMRPTCDKDKKKIQKDAIELWKKMIDPKLKNVRITHDVYLKQYQLSNPKLVGYQCLMMDEAQDCNPAMISIMLSQRLPLILVGDPNQQIYAFRGASNAIQNIRSTHTYHLTKSFRFGPEISYIASCCLEVMNKVKEQTIVGSPKPSYVDGRVEGQYAIISRSNSQLFNEAIRMCCQRRFKGEEPHRVMGAFAGGINSYGFDQLLDICTLSKHPSSSGSPPSVKDKFISKFKTLVELSNYAASVEDSDLLSKIDLVAQHGSKLAEYIRVLREKCKYSLSQANVVFTTAHKSKGLEFDTVCLTDDYPISGFEYSRRGQFQYHTTPFTHPDHRFDMEESNIAYVAVTRAKKCLIIPDKLLRVLHAAQEKFEYPIASKYFMKDSVKQLECANCYNMFVPHTAYVLARRKLFSSNGREVAGGPLCMKCATDPSYRPRVQMDPVVMYLDPTPDFAHRSMVNMVGPLPSDPPLQRESAEIQEMNVVYIINVNVNL